MPLFTYVATYKGETATVQKRSSNFKGWLAQVSAAAFPGLSKEDLAVAMRIDPQPIPNKVRAWSGSVELPGGHFDLHIVETRD